jgi:hypothetical protein
MPVTVEIKNTPYKAASWNGIIHTQANGNAVIELGTVGDAATDFDKYVIQVFDNTVSSTVPVNDIRIAPNAVDRAIINVRNLLQTQIERYKSTANNLFGATGSDAWIPADEWSSEWFLKIGSETGGDLTVDATTDLASLVMGRNYERKLDNVLDEDKIAVISGELGSECTVVASVGGILTDWEYSKPKSSFTDGAPSVIDPTQEILVMNHRLGDWRTLSILQKPEISSEPAPPAAAASCCEGAWVYPFNEQGTQLGTIFVPNTQIYGGGPNLGIFDGGNPLHPYTYMTFNVGAASLPVTTSHYYVVFVVGTPSECSTTQQDSVMAEPAWQPVRFNIVQDKCNDYTPINVRWMNSYGFWDYYTFTKKNEKRFTATRNEYSKEIFDYNQPLSTAQWRGRTIYNQKLVEEFTITTDFLQDHEMVYLENMFFSPDIQYIGADGTQYAAVITNKSIVEKTYRKDKLFQLEVTLQNAINLNSQRG